MPVDRSKDRTKLPKWAQSEIERLERNVEYWQKRATAGPEDSDTFARNVGNEADDTPLGRERMIRFQMGSEWWQYIDVRKEDARLVIQANAMIKILPAASNSCRVALEER